MSLKPPIEVVIPPPDSLSTDDPTLDLLWRLMNGMKAKTIVEAGTYHCRFTTVAAAVAKEHGGQVYTADTIDYCMFGSLKPYADIVNFVHDDFKVIGEKYPQIVGKVDFAFIDSGAPFAYQWEAAVRFRHYTLAKQWVRKGGMVVTDDVKADDWIGSNTIKTEATYLLDVGHGLAVWMKP